MATFPSIAPNARSLSLGNTPQLEHTGTSGVSVRFLQNVKRVAQKLTLTYESITESSLQLIYAHYETQQGSLLPFDLPAVVWSGYTSIPVSSVDYEWRYALSPQVSPTTPGRFSLTIELQSVIK